MAEQIGGVYPTQIPSLSDVADIQEALRIYHYGRPSGTGTGEYDPAGTNPALLNPSGTTPSVAWYLYDLQNQVSTISGSLGVQATTWNAKGALVTAISPANLVALAVGSNGQVLTADSTTASGLRWAAPEISAANAATFTNKNISLATNSISGTLSQFNTALSDADFATLAGTETLTNKTLTSPTVGGTGVTLSGSTSGSTIFRASATASGTITLPAVTGTVITTGDTGTVTDTMLATISTSGKVANSATTATAANTASAIIARDSSGNFSAGTITATGVVGRVTVNSGTTANVGKIFVHDPAGGNPTGAVAGDIWIW